VVSVEPAVFEYFLFLLAQKLTAWRRQQCIFVVYLYHICFESIKLDKLLDTLSEREKRGWSREVDMVLCLLLTDFPVIKLQYNTLPHF
jgi:hypothetical protein